MYKEMEMLTQLDDYILYTCLNDHSVPSKYA